ncbi:PIN domain-containing protein, partial [Rhizobium sp. FY34]|uniref:PIN domain-containing protein n=1 Tax=Rhizobium sp. FY34 TaxID=2562309 RepID=UPI0010C0A204
MIFIDTNVISETLKTAPAPAGSTWLVRHDAEIALSSVVIAEIAFGIQKIRPDERAYRLEKGLIRVLIDQNPLAHSLRPIDMIRHGWLSSL